MLGYDEFDDDDETTPPGSGGDESGPIRKLRQENRQLKEQVKSLPELQRKLAAHELGLDPNKAQVKLFFKAQDIDFSDMEAVRAAAEEFELIQPAGAEQNAEQEAEAAAQERIAGAGAGGAAPDAGGTVTDYSQAQTPEEVLEMVRANGGEVWIN